MLNRAFVGNLPKTPEYICHIRYGGAFMDFIQLLTQAFGSVVYLLLGLSGNGSFPRRLSSTEENRYIELMQQGDEGARSKLIEHNLRLVAYINRKYYSLSNDIDDLISIGTIGLIKAVDTFSPDKGIRLSSYASRCIENEVLMYLRSTKKTAANISISEPIETDRQGNTITIIDVIADGTVLADELETKIQSEKLRKCLEKLSDKRSREIIVWRYGLDGNEPMTQKEIADKFDISRSYVSRLEKKALSELADMMNNKI